ncbi:phosphotransferase [Pedobacter sp. NJ-S-72]
MIFSENYIKELISKYYNLEVSVEKTSGYEDQNFLLTDNQGNRFICKVNTDLEHPYFLDAQLKAMQHLSDTLVGNMIQSVIDNKDGDALTTLKENGENLYVRVLSYLAGTCVGDLLFPQPEIFESLGNVLGQLDKHLAGFVHPAAYRFTEWDLANVLNSRENLKYIRDDEKRTMASYFLLQYEMEVVPLLPDLRKAVIHNDANDYNVLISNDTVSGIIDFGDMVESTLINNLAVACTYAMFRQFDPLVIAEKLIKSYHAEYPLTKTELSVLYYLIAARLCKSVTTSARLRSQSDNKHHFISEMQAWMLLYQLIKINPMHAKTVFINVADMIL